MDEELVLDCPSCGELTDHELLRAAEAGWTVRCVECRTAHVAPAPPRERTILVPLILSEGSSARTTDVEVPLDGPVAVDDELRVEGHRILVTAVETRTGSRPKSVPGRDVKTVYAKVFDTVELRLTLNEGEVTRSFRLHVPPEREVHVGEVLDVEGMALVVKTLKSDLNRTLHRGYLLARNVSRVFCDHAPTGARTGTRQRTRRRGAGPWGTPPKKPPRRIRPPGAAGGRRA